MPQIFIIFCDVVIALIQVNVFHIPCSSDRWLYFDSYMEQVLLPALLSKADWAVAMLCLIVIKLLTPSIWIIL